MSEIIIYTNPKNMKRVSFSPDTKINDQTRQHIILYHEVVIHFFLSKLKNPFDILKIIRNKKYSENILLHYFIHEIVILKNKLEELKKEEEIMENLRKYFKIYPQKNIEEEDPYWDLKHFKNITLTNMKRGIALIRTGNRLFGEKLIVTHLPHVNKLIKLLHETIYLLKYKKTLGDFHNI